MASGRAGRLDPASPLARETYLVIADLAGSAGNARILAAAAIDAEAIERLFADRIEARTEITFDPQAAALRARAVRRLGAVNLGARPLPVPADTGERGDPGARHRRSRDSNACPGRRRCRSGAPGCSSCTPPRARHGRTCRTRPSARTAAAWLAPALIGRRPLGGRHAGRPRRSPAGPAALAAPRPARHGGADPRRGADRLAHPGGLHRRGAGPGRTGAGTLRPRPASQRRRPSAGAAPPVAGAAPDPDHPRSAGLLAGFLGRRCARRCAGAIRAIPGRRIPLSEAPTRRAKPRGT